MNKLRYYCWQSYTFVRQRIDVVDEITTRERKKGVIRVFVVRKDECFKCIAVFSYSYDVNAVQLFLWKSYWGKNLPVYWPVLCKHRTLNIYIQYPSRVLHTWTDSFSVREHYFIFPWYSLYRTKVCIQRSVNIPFRFYQKTE